MATPFKLFNMTFNSASEALDFFCFTRQLPLAACRQPEVPHPLGYANTLSDYSCIGGGLYWHRSEQLFTRNDAQGNGINPFDGEEILDFALIEGIHANGSSLPLLAQFRPEKGEYDYHPLTKGIHSFDVTDIQGSARSMTIVVLPDLSVWVDVVSPRDKRSVEVLAWQILGA